QEAADDRRDPLADVLREVSDGRRDDRADDRNDRDEDRGPRRGRSSRSTAAVAAGERELLGRSRERQRDPRGAGREETDDDEAGPIDRSGQQRDDREESD